MSAVSFATFSMPFVSVMKKILRPQQMVSDEGVGNNTRGRVCSPFFPNLIAVRFSSQQALVSDHSRYCNKP
jgi:hypothetical protein